MEESGGGKRQQDNKNKTTGERKVAYMENPVPEGNRTVSFPEKGNCSKGEKGGHK